MPNIKIVEMTTSSYSNYDSDDYNVPEHVFLSDTPWETVTENELRDLKAWAKTLYGSVGVLIIEDSSLERTRPSVEEYLEKAEAERKKREKAERAAAKAREESAEKRKAREIEKKRKQLEKLKVELGEA